MELLKVSISLIVAILMLKFQPENNNERLMFVGLTMVVSYLLTKDIRNSILIVIISYLINNILKSNMNSIKNIIGSKRENFVDDSDEEDESGSEDDLSDESNSESETDNDSNDESENESNDESESVMNLIVNQKVTMNKINFTI